MPFRVTKSAPNRIGAFSGPWLNSVIFLVLKQDRFCLQYLHIYASIHTHIQASVWLSTAHPVMPTVHSVISLGTFESTSSWRFSEKGDRVQNYVFCVPALCS